MVLSSSSTTTTTTVSSIVTFSANAAEALRSSLRGEVFLPGDAGYAEAVFCWGVLIRHEPMLVVLPETTDDVVRAVRFAAEHHLPVGVQGTGHGQPVPCAGGMLINTSRMQGVQIDPQNRTAHVQAGVKWASVIPLAQEHGLAPLNGSSSDVGVIGYTLGGGHGWLARKYGRAADRIISADVVLANGKLVHVSADSEPELFWALKGGSGNFGIVTELEFELVPVETVYGGNVIYPLADARHVLTEYSRWSATLPEEITSSVVILRLPPLPQLPPVLQGLEAIVIRACAVGDLAAGEARIAPMRALGTPVMDTFTVMPYTAIDAISMDPTDPMPAMGTTMMLGDLDAATIDALVEAAGPNVQSPLLMIDVRDLRVPVKATDPRAHIHGLQLYAVGLGLNEELGAAVQGSLSALREAMRPHIIDRVMLNFLGEGDIGAERTRAAYPAAEYARLQEIKRRYDPENRFRFNHNIAP